MKGVSGDTRALVLARDRGQCQWCGKAVGADYSLQHRRARGMGGSRRPDTNAPSNLITVCGSATTGCHGWIEAHPTEAARIGFRVSQARTPAEVLVITHGHGVVYLRDDGTVAHTRERRS